MDNFSESIDKEIFLKLIRCSDVWYRIRSFNYFLGREVYCEINSFLEKHRRKIESSNICMFSSTAHLSSGLDFGWEYQDDDMNTLQANYKFALRRFLICMIGHRHPITLIPLSRKFDDQDWEDIYMWIYDEFICDKNAFKDDEFTFTIENSSNYVSSDYCDKDGFLVRIERKRKKRKRKEDYEGVVSV